MKPSNLSTEPIVPTISESPLSPEQALALNTGLSRGKLSVFENRLLIPSLLALGLTVACASGETGVGGDNNGYASVGMPGDGDGDGDDQSQAEGDGDGDPVGDGDGDGEGTGDGDGEDGPKLDVLPGQDVEDQVQEPGCNGKVDLHYIVDNSGSMAPHQDNLMASAPGMVEELSDLLGDNANLHVLVSSTGGFHACQLSCNLNDAVCDTVDDQLGTDICDNPNGGGEYSECSSEIGGGLRDIIMDPDGPNGPALPYVKTCPTPSDAEGRFFDSENHPSDVLWDDLEDFLSCNIVAGIAGPSIERPLDSMIGGTSPENNDPNEGGPLCNNGFLRDDALYVPVFLTDEDQGKQDLLFDSHSSEEAHTIMLDRKGGPQNIVMVGLFGDENNDGICDPVDIGQSGHHIKNAFEPQGNEEKILSTCYSVTLPDYPIALSNAALLIDEGCENFEAPE